MEGGNQENMKKKNMSIKLVTGGAGGGAGLAGIILLGGALALVSTFAFKRKQQSKSKKINQEEDLLNKSKVKEDHELVVGEGLCFLVPNSLSHHINNHHHPPSNGTAADSQDELVSRQTITDVDSEINGGNGEEIDIPKKTKDGFCAESNIITEKFPVPVADNSLPLKPEDVKKKNDILEVDKETTTPDSNQIGGVDNDWKVTLEANGNGEIIDENNHELVKAAQNDDQLGLDEKAHKSGEECDGNGKATTERKDILVEGTQSHQPGSDDYSHKLVDEFGRNGEIILEKRVEPIEAAVAEKIRVDDYPHKVGEECYDDAGLIIEKGKELVGEIVAANGIQSTEKLEVTTMYGDQDILCSDGIIISRNGTEICDLKKADLLFPVINSLSLVRPGDNDLVEDILVVEDTKILKGDEVNEAADQDDHSKVENRAHTQLIEGNGDNKENYKTYIETNNKKCEEANEISVENDQQMQRCEEYQKGHINEDQEKYSSDKSLPEKDSFQSNGFEVQEFSFPPLESPSLFKSGKLNKNDSAETALQAEDVNRMEKDGSADEAFAYRIMLENKPSIQSTENDETKSCDDDGDNAAAKGEETLETSLVDIAQQTKLSEEEDNNDDSRIDEEAVEIIQRENFEVENNLQSLLKEEDNDCKDSIGRDEYDDSDDKDVEDDIDSDTEEEDNVEEVEESSETTGDSSMDSNAEAIWPDESVLEFSHKVKDMQASNKNFKETIEEDSYVNCNRHKLEDDDKDSFKMACSKKLSAETTISKQPTDSFNLKFWVLSLLVPFLLLIWLSSSQTSLLGSSHLHLE